MCIIINSSSIKSLFLSLEASTLYLGLHKLCKFNLQIVFKLLEEKKVYISMYMIKLDGQKIIIQH